jgi:importin subunit alpha-1
MKHDSSGENTMMKVSLRVLQLLSSGTVEQRSALFDTHMVPDIVKLVVSNDDDAMHALHIVKSLVRGTQDHAREILQMGVVPRLLTVMTSGSVDCALLAADTMGSLAKDTTLHSFIFKEGAVPCLVALLDSDEVDRAKGAVAVLRNLASGTNTHRQTILDAGVLPRLVNLARTTDEFLAVTAIWALGNLAAGTNKQRQAILDTGLLPFILECIDRDDDSTEHVIGIWRNLAAGHIMQKQALIDAGVLPKLVSLTRCTEDCVKTNVMWALRNLAAGNDKQRQAILDAGLLPSLLECIDRDDDSMQYVIGIWRNLAAGNVTQKQALIDAGILRLLLEVLNTKTDETVEAEALRTLVNLSEGNSECRTAIINARFIPELLGLMRNGKAPASSIAASVLPNLAHRTAKGKFAISNQGLWDGVMEIALDDKVSPDVREMAIVAVREIFARSK